MLIAMCDCMLTLLGPGVQEDTCCSRIGELIQEACSLTTQGEKDELKLYRLAFRWHALQGQEGELMDVF